MARCYFVSNKEAVFNDKRAVRFASLSEAYATLFDSRNELPDIIYVDETESDITFRFFTEQLKRFRRTENIQVLRRNP
jgi:hypothetical protein